MKKTIKVITVAAVLSLVTGVVLKKGRKIAAAARQLADDLARGATDE
jgi:hypothetical protein